MNNVPIYIILLPGTEHNYNFLMSGGLTTAMSSQIYAQEQLKPKISF